MTRMVKCKYLVDQQGALLIGYHQPLLISAPYLPFKQIVSNKILIQGPHTTVKLRNRKLQNEDFPVWKIPGN